MTRRVPFAIGSVALASVLTLIGTFSGPDDDPFWTWLVVLAIILVGAAVVFWLVVPRITNLSRGALILAIIGAVLVVVFWTGLPPIFAGAAALLALSGRERGGANAAATAALVLAALTLVAASVVAFIG
jgi:hypothetical protein